MDRYFEQLVWSSFWRQVSGKQLKPYWLLMPQEFLAQKLATRLIKYVYSPAAGTTTRR